MKGGLPKTTTLVGGCYLNAKSTKAMSKLRGHLVQTRKREMDQQRETEEKERIILNYLICLVQTRKEIRFLPILFVV